MKYFLLLMIFFVQINLFGQKDTLLLTSIEAKETAAKCPKGGESAMDRVRYPQKARTNGIQGTVLISFIVEMDGSLTNWNIVKNIGGGCGEEAIRVFKTMPNWIPATKNGIPIRSMVTKSLTFKFE